MVIKKLCTLVIWMTVASALKGLINVALTSKEILGLSKVKPRSSLVFQASFDKGPSQDLETGCPKLAVVKLWTSYFSRDITTC